ncbi:MAG: hypothetical protein ACR2K9_04890 [Solirubrobacteraceae bacterium]
MPDTSRELPFIDEHSREVAASAEAAWDAVNHVVRRSFSGPAKSAVARALGCTETELVGFRIAVARPPEILALQGRHRFSSYELNFRIESLGPDQSRVKAETRAAFPGLAGRAYKTAVIGTRGHVVAVNSLLGAIAARAERPR